MAISDIQPVQARGYPQTILSKVWSTMTAEASILVSALLVSSARASSVGPVTSMHMLPAASPYRWGGGAGLGEAPGRFVAQRCYGASDGEIASIG